jgi:hypothetical protein
MKSWVIQYRDRIAANFTSQGDDYALDTESHLR